MEKFNQTSTIGTVHSHLQDYKFELKRHIHSRTQAGPEIMALITPLPSSLFPARVALKAIIASSKLNLKNSIRYKLITYTVVREREHFTDE